MTITEICLLIITIALIATAAALTAMVLSLRVSVRLLEGLIRDSGESVRRIDEVGAELQIFMQRANRDYRVVSDVAGRVLDEVSLPVRNVASVIRGVRTGIGVLLHRGGPPSNSTHNARSTR